MAARAYAPRRAGTGRPRRAPGGRSATARRPAARRRPRARRGASRVDWDRLGRVALTLVLGAVLLSYFNPLRDFVQTYRAAEQGKERLAALQVENGRLERRVAASRDPGVVEREARRQGMVWPGERAYVIKGLR